MTDSTGIGYTNLYTDDQSYIYYITNLNDGYIDYDTPNIDLSVLGHGDITGQIIASTYIGDVVAIPVYFSCNFDYTDGFVFNLAFDPELTYDSIVTTSYSTGAYDTLSMDSTVQIKCNSSSLTRSVFQFSIENINLLTVYFTIDTATAEYDSNYKVRIKGDYSFFGCDDYYGTETASSSEYVYAGTVVPSATWRFGTRSASINMDNFAYDYSLKTNVPIATYRSDSVSALRFSFYPDQFQYVEYQRFESTYSYNDSTLSWQSTSYYDTLFVSHLFENYNSPDIQPSWYFAQVGELVFDAGSSIGEDSVEYYQPSSGASSREANYVIPKYTNDSLNVPDGNLSLINGFIEVINPPPPGGGCPMLYTWTGSGYILENTILTHSQGKTNPKPEDDYYPISRGVIAEDGFYNLQIREIENEITYLDQVELIVVDYPNDFKVGISNEGQVYSYNKVIKPIKAVDAYHRDVLEYVGNEDDVWLDVHYPGWIQLTYENPNYTEKCEKLGNCNTSFSLGSVPPDPVIKKAINVENTNGEGENLIAEVKDINGNWYYLGAQPPREFQSENSRWICDLSQIVLGEIFEVKISWKATYRVDLQALFIGESTDYIEHKIKPEKVKHPDQNTAGKLLNADSDILTIKPGETLDISFAVPTEEVPEGYNRKFFFKSKGYYINYASTLIPNDFALHDNYPNPFNPSTTISFSIPKATEVTLDIYNILGQRVVTLFDGMIDAGTHTIEWGGDNDKNEPVASGVYFYRLKAGTDFEESKKMVLLK